MRKKAWHHSKESAAERGYGHAWRKVREHVMRRDCGLCQCTECTQLGRLLIATEIDHIVPKAKGGTDDLDNLQAISAECHQRKTLAENGKQARTVIGADGWPV
jgi:5-methylcytosine-specific restriction protein A